MRIPKKPIEHRWRTALKGLVGASAGRETDNMKLNRLYFMLGAQALFEILYGDITDDPDDEITEEERDQIFDRVCKEIEDFAAQKGEWRNWLREYAGLPPTFM